MYKSKIKTEKQYLEEVKKLRNSLSKDSAAEINKKLDTLYEIKPVRLEWILAKIDTLLELNENVDDYKSLLYTHYWALKDSDKFRKILDALISINERLGNTTEAERLKFELYINFSQDQSEEQERYNEMFQIFSELLVNFIENNSSKSDIKKIIELAYLTSDFTLVTIFEHVFAKQLNEQLSTLEVMSSRPNIFHLNQILKEKESTFTIVFDENNELIILSVIKALKYLGHKLFVLTTPQDFEVDVEIDIAKTLDISMETLQEDEDYTSVIPVRLVKNGDSLGDNRLNLIEYISSNLSKNNFSTALTFNTYMNSVKAECGSNRLLEPLYINHFSYDTLAFGWSGNYCSYIDNLYKTESAKFLNEKPTLDFSIIIPVRNDSSDTLFHALKTCLDIQYDGKYEIVVSDNSSKGNEKVKTIVDKLNDKRIKYYKPPFELSLTKSFEFACLMTKGEFIIPLGADDAVVPNALTELSAAIKSHPEHEFILWKRGFYAWPGFNGGQQNQFSTAIEPAEKQACSTIQTSELWASILKNPASMYTLPLFYINSGFKKCYLKTLLSKTGSLFNGPCQDIYTGIVNISVNKEILFLNKQITFAGMSSASTGANYNLSKTAAPKAAIPSEYSNVYADSFYERYIPSVWNDRGTLYKSVMRAISKGLLPISFTDDIIDFNECYKNMLSIVKKDDIMFELNIELFKTAAARIGEDFLKWFVDTYYSANFEPFYIDEADYDSNERYYKVGFTEKALTLDASEFGVKNIHEAIHLYKKLAGI